MSDTENPLKEGFLWFPPHGVLGQLKKSWQKKFCQLFKCSKYGVDRLEVYDNEEEVGKTSSNVIITLENCVKITRQDAQKHQANVFAVITKSNINYFSANSEEEMNDWMSVFQTVAFKDNISRQTIEEDNDLYCSSEDAGIFNVKLVSSEASVRCELPADYYTLLAGPVALNLLDSKDQKTLYTWPYRYIRRYGYKSGKFTFEAGRKCETGEGDFHFEHPSKDIFKCIATRMKNMKSLLNRESHSLLCGDNQFQAALSMVARSRSPLPPSPTSATPFLDSEICGFSTVKPLTPYFNNSSGNNLFLPNNHDILPPPLKPKSLNQTDLYTPGKLPEKPARKVMNTDVNENECNFRGDSRDIHDIELAYDDVEVRNEAWRTMGRNDPAEIKTLPTPTVNPSQTVSCKLDKSESHKIFFVPHHGLAGYDKLQHIGPAQKHIIPSGYKQIPLLTNSISNLPVEEPKFPCRRADDFKGYGMIRKKTAIDTSIEDVSKQFLSDDFKYTIACKPERV